MKKFNKEMTCSKCGSDDLLHRYKKKGERLDENLCVFDKAECELIRTICRCCGYRWSSLPLDIETKSTVLTDYQEMVLGVS